MGLLFTSAPTGYPRRFTHRSRSGPAHSTNSGQTISTLPGSVRSASSAIHQLFAKATADKEELTLCSPARGISLTLGEA